MVDAKEKVVREVKIASEPEALVRYFGEQEAFARLIPSYRQRGKQLNRAPALPHDREICLRRPDTQVILGNCKHACENDTYQVRLSPGARLRVDLF